MKDYKVDKQFKKGFVGIISVLESLVLLLLASVFICAIICVIPYFFGGGLIVELLNAYLVSTTFLQHLILGIFNLSSDVTIYVSLVILGLLSILLIRLAVKDYMKYRPGSGFIVMFKILIFALIGSIFIMSGVEAVSNLYPLESYIFLCFLFGGLSVMMVLLDFIVLVVDKSYYKRLKLSSRLNTK